MTSDVVVAQYASAGLVLLGLLTVFSATMLFPTRVSIGEVTRKNPVPWSPRDLGGGGNEGKSPIFGVSWGIIFFFQFLFALLLLIESLQSHKVADVAALFNQCACVGGALMMASVWSPLFTQEKTWTFVLASVLLVVTAVISTMGAVLAKPLMQPEPVVVLGGVATTFLAGWSHIAAALSVGIVTRVYNRGINAASSADGSSFYPIGLSVVEFTLATILGNPIFPLPLLLTLPFVPGIFSDWKTWVPAVVCAVGMLAGGFMYTVYDQFGYPF